MVLISYLSFTQNSLHSCTEHTLVTNIKPKAIPYHPHCAAKWCFLLLPHALQQLRRSKLVEVFAVMCEYQGRLKRAVAGLAFLGHTLSSAPRFHPAWS